MKKYLLTISKSVILCLSLNVAANAAELTDKKITTEIKLLLAQEADIPSNMLHVSTDKRIVNIEGEVETRLQADRIAVLANSVNEVKDVNFSKLHIKKSDQYLKDAFLSAVAKGKLINLARHNKIGKDFEIHVETTNGNMHLYGTVENKRDIAVVIKELRRIKGVKKLKYDIYY